MQNGVHNDMLCVFFVPGMILEVVYAMKKDH